MSKRLLRHLVANALTSRRAFRLVHIHILENSPFLIFSCSHSHLHLHEQPLTARDLGMDIVVVDKIVQRREPKADPPEIFQQRGGVAGSVDGDDESVAGKLGLFTELEESHEAVVGVSGEGCDGGE